YVKISAEIENNEELKKKVQEILVQLESGHPKIQKSLEKIRKISITAFEKNYKKFNIEFDEMIGDSAFVEKAKHIVDELLEKKIAFKEPTGEVVADLEQYKIPNTILLRSNGTTLYSTRDLALIDYKHEKYQFELSVLTTGSEQNLHFRQVLKIMELLGRKYNSKHIGFGLIELPEGKMSTRQGKVILLEDVLNQAAQAALEKITQTGGKEREYSETELKQISEGVGIGALKFAVLRVSPDKNIVFDFNNMTSFEGDTGAYLQYSLVRVKSVLAKAKALRPKATSHNFNDEEKQLLLALAVYPSLLTQASESLTPHTMCDYLLKVAGMFSTFYSKHSILNAEANERSSRLAITKATGAVMENGLNVIGITPLKKM
ncbi:MAG: arginine--tRNA ligase, partial [Candidatus Woesearchaeota archaeon]|nr:arginine--tRNA ligase [Candidatus Woesearchaeota archaeon]